jgi:transposase-like protein
MKCPRCSSDMREWPSPSGGYKGVECGSCGGQWHSEGFERAAYEVEKAAVRALLAKTPFPPDAKTHEEYWADLNADADREYDDELMRGTE